MQIVLTVVEGPHLGKTFAFDQHDHFFVGRAKFAHFRLPEKDPYFSRMHFLIEANPPACRLLDLDSTNGTAVNGQAVRSADLRHGDRIEAGNTVIRVTLRENAEVDLPATVIKPSSGPELTPAPTKPSPHQPYPLTSPRPLPDPVRDGWRAPGYELSELLGRGAMGLVYRGRWLAQQRDVAVKVIQPKSAGSAADVQRFLREVDILRQLDHSTIVRLYETGEADGLLYFSMELVPGINAKQYVEQQRGLLSPQTAAGIIGKVLEGLAHAHERGFVHRDVKPGNILLEKRGGKLHVKLADFGLARAYEQSRLSGLTLTGDLCGTPYFMAPEQITDCRRVKPACDIYSSAATLYWLLTKKSTHDFRGTIQQLLPQILLDEPVPIEQRRPDLPSGLVECIHRGLCKDPAERFASAEEFRQALM